MSGRGKSRRSLELIEASIEILREIQPATVRAICYRLFTEGFIPSMAKNETNRVGRQLVDARESGDIPWAWIVDETRRVEGLATWADPAEFAKAVTASYRRNKWAAQPVRLEVWSEKGTVRGTLAPVLDRYEVPFRVQHGFASATALHAVAREYVENARQPLQVLYVGDWDPSGLHMSEEDLPERLWRYCIDAWGEVGAPGAGEDDVAIAPTILRVALTEDDVADPVLPSFPAGDKRGDPRYRWFAEQYGQRCWELDALSPAILRTRVEAAINARLDHPAWNRYVEAERVEIESITNSVQAWQSLTAVQCGGRR